MCETGKKNKINFNDFILFYWKMNIYIYIYIFIYLFIYFVVFQ